MPSSMTNRREWQLLLVLATIQFTQVMDFVIMMPLGPQFMRAFSIGTAEFGWMISAYAFAAAISGAAATLFIDRFDRKSALLFLYAGFAIGTLLCAIAGNHHFFVFGRVVAGAFAGIMTPVTYAIIGDAIPQERRGAANGTVMSSFSVASVAGVPLGLVMANTWSWHAPFLLLVGISIIAGIIGLYVLPSMRGHLTAATPSARGLKSVGALLQFPNHRWSLALIACLVMAGFTVIPYAATAIVANAELPETKLPLTYLFGGAATLFTSRYFGKLADRHGTRPVFWTICVLSIVPLLGLAYIVPMSLPWILLLMTVFTVLLSGRFVVGSTLIHNGIDPQSRGSFLSLMASFQQSFSGIASLIAGFLVSKSATGQLEGMPKVGWLAVCCTFLASVIATRIEPATHAPRREDTPVMEIQS